MINVKEQLHFNLIQNWNKEFPDLEPYQVIQYSADKHPSAFSGCDEYGNSDFCPYGKEGVWFAAADEETVSAFIVNVRLLVFLKSFQIKPSVLILLFLKYDEKSTY